MAYDYSNSGKSGLSLNRPAGNPYSMSIFPMRNKELPRPTGSVIGPPKRRRKTRLQNPMDPSFKSSPKGLGLAGLKKYSTGLKVV